jgi:hypothetical protein
VCVDYGRFSHRLVAVTNAARVGAAFGSLYAVPSDKTAWDAAIRQAVEDELSNNAWFDASQLTLPAPGYIDEGGGFRRVRVELSYPFQTLVPWPLLPGYGDPVPLRGTVVMRSIR